MTDATEGKSDAERIAEFTERVQAQEQVLRDYVAQIQMLTKRTASAIGAEAKAKHLQHENDALKDEVEMYRALVKGWPKGRKLVKRLTREYD